MGLIASSSPMWTLMTDTNSNGSGNNMTVEYYDNSGANFKLKHNGSSRYNGIRLNGSKHRDFRMSYDWQGSNSTSYFGPFWANTHASHIWGGSSTGYKLVSYPDSGTTMSYRLRGTNDNQDDNSNGNVITADQDDGSTWHNTVVEVRGDQVRVLHNGLEALTCGYAAGAQTAYGAGELNAAGYCGLILYTGDVEVRNFNYTELVSNTMWEPIGTYTRTDSYDWIQYADIFDQGFSALHMEIAYLGTTADGPDVHLRFLDESDNPITSSYYYSGANQIGTNANSEGQSWYADGANIGTIWKDAWGHSAGGIHGTIDFYNYHIGHKVLNNTMSHEGAYNQVRPICKFDLIGYKQATPQGYSRQSGLVRYNSSQSEGSFGGFRIFTQTGSIEQDPEVHLFGLRAPSY